MRVKSPTEYNYFLIDGFIAKLWQHRAEQRRAIWPTKANALGSLFVFTLFMQYSCGLDIIFQTQRLRENLVVPDHGAAGQTRERSLVRDSLLPGVMAGHECIREL